MSCMNPSPKKICRRDLLRWGAVSSAVLSLPAIANCGGPEGDRQVLTMTEEWRAAFSPSEVLELAKAGNERFVNDKRIQRDYLADQRALAGSQHPVAVVLSCIDSRAPVEMIFDAGIGDVFNARVAGNFVNRDIAGSIEYACAVAGARLLLVMGHTDCGAIKGAIDGVELGNLTALLERLKPAVSAVEEIPGERSSKNTIFVDAVAAANVRLTVQTIRAISPILRDLEAERRILIAGALYRVESGAVEFLT